jgi:hypothetical protein
MLSIRRCWQLIRPQLIAGHVLGGDYEASAAKAQPTQIDDTAIEAAHGLPAPHPGAVGAAKPALSCPVTGARRHQWPKAPARITSVSRHRFSMGVKPSAHQGLKAHQCPIFGRRLDRASQVGEGRPGRDVEVRRAQACFPHSRVAAPAVEPAGSLISAEQRPLVGLAGRGLPWAD